MATSKAKAKTAQTVVIEAIAVDPQVKIDGAYSFLNRCIENMTGSYDKALSGFQEYIASGNYGYAVNCYGIAMMERDEMLRQQAVIKRIFDRNPNDLEALKAEMITRKGDIIDMILESGGSSSTSAMTNEDDRARVRVMQIVARQIFPSIFACISSAIN